MLLCGDIRFNDVIMLTLLVIYIFVEWAFCHATLAVQDVKSSKV